MPKKKTESFESSLEALEAIVNDMESGELSLEDSLASFEKGIKLIRQCQKNLSDAEQRVQMLIESNGELETEPFLEGPEAE